MLNNFVKCVWSVELYESSWNQGGSKVLDFHPSIQFEYRQNEKQIKTKKILREKKLMVITNLRKYEDRRHYVNEYTNILFIP